jgi:phosphoglycolate phosphatase
MGKYDSLLFDLDGTLTDSGPGIKRCVRHAYDKLGYTSPEETELNTFVGPPLDTSFASHGIPEDQVWEAIRLFRDRYNVTGKYENTPYAGIRELLEELKEEGYHLFVATSKPEALAKDVLHHFDLDIYFEEIAGATFDRTRVDKDAVIAWLLSKADVSKAVMIGDTRFDVLGAKRHGIPCIGVSWGYGTRQSLEEAGAIAIVDTMSALKEAVTA